MAINTQSKGGIVVVAKQLAAVIPKRLSSTTPVAFDGRMLTPDQIVSKLQALVDLRTDVDAAQAMVKAKLAAEAAQAPALRAFTRQVRAYLKATLATSPDALAEFGITSKSRAALTLEGKAAAVAKSAATRAARHTMGPRQKAGVKGDVIGVVVTPTRAVPIAAAPSHATVPATSEGPNMTGAATTPHTA
jgi:hypothetical protein